MPGAKNKKNKKNKKNGQRRAAPRTNAPAPPQPDGAQTSTVPAGLASAKTPPPGLTPAKTVPPGLTPAKAAAPTLTPASAGRPDPILDIGEYSKLVPGASWPTGPVSVRSAAKAATAAETPTATAEPTSAAAEPAPSGEDDALPTWAAKALEEVLTATYWLDPGEYGDPFDVTIRFSGRRSDMMGKPGPGDTFSQDETIEGIIPGSGPVAITAEVRGVKPGPWTVTARPAPRPGSTERRPFRPYPPPGDDRAEASRVPPPRRVPITAGPGTTIHTARLLRCKVPGITRFAYATLTCLGVLTGLGLETVLLIASHYSVLRPLVFSVAAVVAGVVGGKAWYIAVSRMGIGRFGCFWAGCCTGRPTAARWGIWSSDRRVGCRRAPAQPLEAVASLTTGAAVLAVVLIAGLHRSGPVAVAGLAAYTLCRQALLGLRAEPRRWRQWC